MTKTYARYALGVIFFANFLSYFDRQIVGVLEADFARDFGMNKEQFGYLVTAFTLGYMVFAPVVGFMTDRYRRTRIFALCIFLWSFATLGSGYAYSKSALYAARFFIGIGEAGCLVIGPTLISDYFAREVRGRALSVFFLALPLGGAAGYIVGGILADELGWRNAFYLAGVPGFLVAALVWMLVEPPRGGSETGVSHGKIHGVRPYLDLLRNRTLVFVILAQAFAVITLAPLIHFGVEFFQGKYRMDKASAATTLGGIALVAGACGNFLSGFLGDRMAKRRKGAYAFMAGFAFAVGFPCLLIGFISTPKAIGLPFLTLGAFCYFLCMPAVNTQIANAVTPQQRAMAYGLAVFILHLLGDMAANPVFGKIADARQSKQQAYVLFSFTLVLASVCCFLAARSAPRDEARAQELKPDA